MPRRRSRAGLWVLLIAVVLLIIIPQIAQFDIDWLWFKELGRSDVFWTYALAPWLLGTLTAVLFFSIVFVNVMIALRSTSDYLWEDLRQRLHARALHLLDRTLRRLAFWGGVALTILFAVVVGRSVAQYWPKFLLAAHAQHVGVTDPIFKNDVGFYLFQLPIWHIVASVLFSALIFALILTTIVYLSTRVIRIVRRIPVFAPEVQRHLSVLLSLLFIVKGGQYLLGRYTLLYSSTGSLIGPNYTDVHARIPALMIMAIFAGVAAVVVLIGVARKNILLPIGSIVGVMVASILLLGIYPALVQRFKVDPDELTLERPYLAQHIAFTRRAYGLDKVREVPFNPTPSVTSTALNAAPETVQNIRLWDYRPLLQVYSQRQDLRTYYDIANVDVDRYTINGQLRQVMLAARELNTDNIQGQQTWVKQHLLYTHGYGLVMSPVNEIDREKGEPVFFINDIPPTVSAQGINVTRPEIYFGELESDYAVVKSRQQEFDYPGGDDNVYTTYRGTAGIPLRNPLIRACAAIRFNALNLLISDTITRDSRLLFRRQVLDRVQTLAPFLVFDQDPYLVIGNDGKLYWMIDAYTGSGSYPYSRYSTLQTAGDGHVELNYLRNPVKAVVDAYNGGTTFYVTDTHEPIIHAWQEIFPSMFKPLASMPVGLAQHIRIPEGYFDTISEVYRRYHMIDPSTFYQQEDLWDIPQESTGLVQNGETSNMEAYYLAMSLPGQHDPEYLLIRPYTPKNKKNMIAWLSARSDPEHYGELLVYNFPKQSLVFGPEQVLARINQDPEISSAVSLWNQSGSQVLWGNLLVIPIGQTVLYVQPVYLQAERSQIPELQRVIVADQQQVVMRPTLDEALAALTGVKGENISALAQNTPKTPTPPAVSPANRALARSALDHFQRAQDAVQRGDWAAYGTEMDGVKHDLEQMNNQ
ncbi:MAG TPA: UPF0182 family protein [Armatimonadota bacterium]|nr:UPF0182 family protein [Armatimonadota bacterium]